MATNSKFNADLGLKTDADLQVDGNVTVSGNLTVNGTQTTVNSTTTSVEDSMLELANSNLSSDTLDIGIYGNYDDGLGDGVSEYTGFFRDATDSTWKLFDGLESEPTTTVNTSGTGYTLADLQVGDLTATTLTATNALTGSSITYPTSDGTNGQVLKTNGSGALFFGNFSLDALSDCTISAAIPNATTNPPYAGAMWIEEDTGVVYVCTNATTDNNTWVKTGGVAGIVSSADATAITIDSSERVGINTSSPSTELHVYSADQNALKVQTNTGINQIELANSTNSPTYITANSYALELKADDNGWGGTASAIKFNVKATERMRIASAGHVLVNTTALQGAGGLSLQVGGNNVVIENNTTSSAGNGTEYQVFRRNSSQIGSITMNGTTAVQYNTSSDYRLKENVVAEWDATTRLKQLKPSRFNFITEPDRTVDGFLAHEVQDIVPEAISGTKDATEELTNVVINNLGNVIARDIEESDWITGKEDETYPSDSTWEASHTANVYQGIDQSKLVPLLVKTIQELEARITTLENA
jgi:hypothetical protein